MAFAFPEEELEAAIQAAKDGDLERAESLCRDLLGTYPSSPDILQILGLVLKNKGKLDEAERMFRQSLNFKPGQPNVWCNLGNLLADKDDGERALVAYQTALKHAPEFEDAHAGLSVQLLNADDPEAALQAALSLLRHNPNSARGYGLAGSALLEVEGLNGAATAFSRAIQLDPNYIDAHYKLGIVLRLSGKPREALDRFKVALKFNSRMAEIYYHQGHALYDIGDLEAAFASYLKAIELRPDYLVAHEILNKLYWEHGRESEFLQSYRDALKKAPDAVGLYVNLAQYLAMIGKLEEASAVLQDAERRVGPAASVSRILARIEADKGRWDDAIDQFDQAIELEPDNLLCLQDFTRVLIMREKYEKASKLVKRVKGITPLDQQNLAYEWLCGRFLGDPEAERMYDYDRFVRAYEIACPDGYSDIFEFNRVLAEHLHTLHTTRNQPLDQTLRFGTQTHGLLFDSTDQRIQAVKAKLGEVVQQYLRDLPRDPDHIFLGRNTGSFEFVGSWSALLGPKGHHINHVHSIGWISSAYYVELPDDLDHANHEGWLKFGETDLNLGDREIIGKIVKPGVGKLVVFPSYMYHGTVPLKTGKPRMTIAFDIIPG